MKQYLALVKTILETGVMKQNRTGMPALTISGHMLQHDMKNGFPLLTTKKMGLKTIATELEFFIKGLTDKRWLQERGCKIWDEWANPTVASYGTDETSKQKMRDERDLGPIYGYQWRNFGGPYDGLGNADNKFGFDQLAYIVRTLKKDPTNRRLVCSAWNPLQQHQMALPPCHVAWHVVVIEGVLHLNWFQRSCDTMLGVPYNLASYALLLLLLAKESNLSPGIVTGFLSDVHIYKNHIENAQLQISRQPSVLPGVLVDGNKTIVDGNGFDIFEWQANDCSLFNYNPQDKIEFEIAV